MTIPAEFEEKEYENALYLEIVRKKNSWTPGQVLEARLGFDAVLDAANAFWAHVGLKRRRSLLLTGSVLGLKRADQLSRAGALPDFSANLFLQAKRCHVWATRPRTLDPWKSELSKSRCYGFSVLSRSSHSYHAPDRHQQSLLGRLHARVKSRAYVAYAAPAFHTRAELNVARKAGSVYSQSTFPAAEWFADHEQWVYTEPGTHGWCCSAPRRREEASLQRYEREAREQNGDPTKNLRILADAVRLSLEDTAKESGPDSMDVAWVQQLFDNIPNENAPTLVGRVALALSSQGILWSCVPGARRTGRRA